MSCPICEDWCGENSKKISRKRASRTAHDLATKKADTGMEGLEWEEVYTLFFPKIYRHEYERNLKLEREIELEESVKRNMNHPDVCSYHAENIMWHAEDPKGRLMKNLRKEYANSKWPKSFKSGYP